MTSPANLEAHRPAITGHCYRMLGSAFEADDAAQETMIRAWKAIEAFDGRASVKTWLHRIATNVCLDALADRKRRARPFDEGAPGTIASPLVERERTHWLEPIPDARVIPADADPSEAAALRQSVRLAFVAALQHLPPRQRAALLLTEVLGWSAAEVAEALDFSVASVNSALQRARASLAVRNVALEGGGPRLTETEEALVARYVEAFERYDVDALATLLREDATFSMPPYDLWLRGPETVRAFLLGPGAACRGSILVPIAANGLPAFAQYKAPKGPGEPRRAWSLTVLELEGGKIAGWSSFLDTESLFPLFELPLELPA